MRLSTASTRCSSSWGSNDDHFIDCVHRGACRIHRSLKLPAFSAVPPRAARDTWTTECSSPSCMAKMSSSLTHTPV